MFVSVSTELTLVRSLLNLKMTEFAQMLGISQPTVSAVEGGYKPVPESALQRYCEMRGWGPHVYTYYRMRQRWDAALQLLLGSDPRRQEGVLLCVVEELRHAWPRILSEAPASQPIKGVSELESVKPLKSLDELVHPYQWATFRSLLEAVLARSELAWSGFLSGSGIIPTFRSVSEFVDAVWAAWRTHGRYSCYLKPTIRLVDLCHLLLPYFGITLATRHPGIQFVITGVSGRTYEVSVGMPSAPEDTSL